MAVQIDSTSYTNYVRTLQLPPGIADGFEDQAFPILYGLTRLRQVPVSSRTAWHQALVDATHTTPDWAKALPDGEFKFRMFILRVAKLCADAYGLRLDDESLKKPNPEYPWSLWPWEWDSLAPRVLGAEGGEAATGQGVITAARFTEIVGQQWTAAQTATLSYLERSSPGAFSKAQEAYTKAGSWLGVGVGTSLLSLFFWKGVKAMSPRLAATLASAVDVVSLGRKALLSWPATLATVVGVAAWDADVTQKNRDVIARYQSDKQRRDYEAQHPLSSQGLIMGGGDGR